MKNTHLLPKKVVRCIDGSFISADSKSLCNKITRYTDDFSDDTISEVMEFCHSVDDNDSAKILSWLLESRRECAAGKIDLGQMKIDVFKNICVFPPESDDMLKCEVKREGDDVLVYMAWQDPDDHHFASAATAVSVNDFLNLEEGSFESFLGQIKNYNTVDED